MDEKTVLYDEHCPLCQGVVRFARARDPAKQLRFVPFQSAEGGAIAQRHGERGDSVVLLDDKGKHRKSDAVVGVLENLSRPWRYLRVLRAVPKAVRDWGYDQVAKRRGWLG